MFPTTLNSVRTDPERGSSSCQSTSTASPTTTRALPRADLDHDVVGLGIQRADDAIQNARVCEGMLTEGTRHSGAEHEDGPVVAAAGIEFRRGGDDGVDHRLTGLRAVLDSQLEAALLAEALA